MRLVIQSVGGCRKCSPNSGHKSISDVINFIFNLKLCSTLITFQFECLSHIWLGLAAPSCLFLENGHTRKRQLYLTEENKLLFRCRHRSYLYTTRDMILFFPLSFVLFLLLLKRL